MILMYEGGGNEKAYTFIIEMYNGETSDTALPFGHDDVSVVQLDTFDEVKVSKSIEVFVC